MKWYEDMPESECIPKCAHDGCDTLTEAKFCSEHMPPCPVCGDDSGCQLGLPVATGHWEAQFKREFDGKLVECELEGFAVLVAKPNPESKVVYIPMLQPCLLSYLPGPMSLHSRHAAFATLLRRYGLWRGKV